MSVHDSRPATSAFFHSGEQRAPVRLFLSGVEGDARALIDVRPQGFPLELVTVPVDAPIAAHELDGAAAAVIQVAGDKPASIDRFEALARDGRTPLIAAAFEPPLALVRSLVRAGAHDVIPLPLDIGDLEAALDPIRRQADDRLGERGSSSARMVVVIKSDGGIGATALLGQLASRFAANERGHGHEACLLDLDVQFGDAAFQLGLQPKLTLTDLLEAGTRVDGEFLRSVATAHPSGLQIVAAPRDVMPLESVTSDQMLVLTDLMKREFGTLFVDLPTNWTNWSLSLVARADLVLMVTELRLASLHGAKRQLDLLASQDLDGLDVRVVVNRYEKRGRSVSEADAERVLGKPIAYTIANDHETMTAAIERGVPLTEIRRKSALGRDLDLLEAGIAAALGMER